MLNRLFAKLASSRILPMNKDVMNGLACTYIPKALEYIDATMRSASNSFPAGLEYVGCSRCTPEDEYNEVCRQKNNKRTFDLSKSDTYLVRFHFRFQGKDLPPRHILLPYVLDGGILHISGPAFHIVPILSDKVISPEHNSLFVKLPRDKIIFNRKPHSLLINSVAQSEQIIYSKIYRNKNKNSSVPKTTDAATCMGHYLFARYGVTGTFLKYCGYVPEFGYEEINEQTYPPSQWSIYQSWGIRPKSFRDKLYTPNKIRIAVRNDQRANPLVHQLVCEFIYAIDHFPERIEVKHMDNTNLWMILLGHIIFSAHFSEGKLHSNIKEHFQSLSEYADLIVIEKLREKGFIIEDFFDLIALILKEFNNLIYSASSDFNNVYDKTYEVLSYALFDITSSIFTTNFKLNKLASKKDITEKDVVETFNKHLRMGEIYFLTSGKIAVSSVSYSGDHKYPKITSVVNEQENVATTTHHNKSRRVIGPKQRIHTSAIEIGSVLFLPKSDPTPVVRINPYVQINIETGSVVPKEHLKDLLYRTQLMLKGVSPGKPGEIDIEDSDDNSDMARQEN